MYNERILPWFKENVADALFLKKQANVRWISGFKGADTCVMVTANGGFLITDPRYTEQAEIEAPDFTLVNWRAVGGSVIKALASIVKENNIKSLAFESDVLSFGEYSELRKLVDIELIPTQGVVEELRSIKTPQEIEYLRNACEISCRAFWRILDDIRVGVTEKELAAKLSAYMVMEGADTQPYGNILISGPNTSLLHGIPSDRTVHYGDFVLMDYGCQFNGYMSDMTRTVAVGHVTDEMRTVYETVLQAQLAGIAAAKAGATGHDVDAAARKVIEDAGYGPYFGHSFGHSVGVEIHEAPNATPANNNPLPRGAAVSAEPGIYLPGRFGVRIEDVLVLQEGGCMDITLAKKDLTIL